MNITIQRTQPFLGILATLFLLATQAWAEGPGEIKFDEDSTSVLEESGVVRLRVERSRGEDGTVSIDFLTTTDGTATPDVDFTPVAGTFTWGDQDETDRFIDLPILDDDEAEGAETVILILANPGGGAIITPGRGSSVVTIQASDGGSGGGGGGDDPGDDPGMLKFDEDSVSVLEEAGTVTIFVERSMGEAGVVSVDYHSTTDGTATEGADYTGVSGTLTWPNLDGGSKSFTIPILDDDLAEGSETIRLVLSNATGGAGIDGTRGTSTVIIQASDGGSGGGGGGGGGGNDPGVLKFDESSFEVLESAGVAIISVERSMGEDGPVGVAYTATAGTATDGADFTSVAGTLEWSSNDGTAKTFVVPILDDTDMEDIETVELTLHDATGGATIDGLRGTAILRILDDDGGNGGDDNPGNDPGVIKFDESSFEVLEEAGVAIITIERSMGEDGAVSVDYGTFDGTASDGSDYTAVSGTLTWAAGDGADKTFVVPILDDDLAEGVETVELFLENATGGAVVDGLRGTSVLRILASDGDGGGDGGGGDDGGGGGATPGRIKFDVGSFQVLEGSVAIVTVERSQGEDGPASVSYRTLDGSATEGPDYTGVSGTLSWADQDGGNKTFAVPIHDDDLAEGNETIALELFGATGATLDPQQSDATLTIVDNDNAACIPSIDTMCMLGGRFKVQVAWQTTAESGLGRPVALSDKSGLFWFFNPNNVEMLFKILDGCNRFGAYWVFFSATTNVGLDVMVTDTVTGQTKVYRNGIGQQAQAVQDTGTFTACP